MVRVRVRVVVSVSVSVGVRVRVRDGGAHAPRAGGRLEQRRGATARRARKVL